MFGFSFSEVIVIAVVALLVLGPERIPVVARSLGRALRELRRSMDEVKHEFSMSEFSDPLNLKGRPQIPRSSSSQSNFNSGLRAEPLKLEEYQNCETAAAAEKIGNENIIEVAAENIHSIKPESET